MSRKLYLFGIGGTGSRVLKSFIMLLAAGCKLSNNFDVVIPIIIDPDTSNGDLNRTKDILGKYQEIREQVNNPDDFFAQDLRTISELSNQSTGGGTDHFQMNLNNVAQATFGEYIGFNSLDENFKNASDDKSFARLLYSESNLKSNLNVGFKGNPNMGAIVLNQLTDSDDFKRFAQTFNDGDSIFIVNSIFGGTGASGFPLLLKNLRGNLDIPNAAKIKDANIGAITYLPYFELNKKDEINSDSFDDKAKIAIDYYNRTIIKHKKVDTIYFIGNRGNTEHMEYAVGGKDQKNRAHFLEMAGALAVFDFCENINNTSHNTVVKEFGIENDTNSISFSDLSLDNKKFMAKPLTKYKLFAEYLNLGLSKSLEVSVWTVSKFLGSKSEKFSMDAQYFSSDEYKLQIEAFNKYFLEWLEEMKENKPSFDPFNKITSDDAFKLVKGSENVKGDKSFKEVDIMNAKLRKKIEYRSSSDQRHTTLIKMFAESLDHALNKLNLLNQD